TGPGALSDVTNYELGVTPADPQHYADGEANISVRMRNRGRLSATVATDKALYDDGDTVRVSGSVQLAGQPFSDTATVTVSVDGKPAAQAATDAAGNFTATFPTSAIPVLKSGATHIITATASARDYQPFKAFAFFV